MLQSASLKYLFILLSMSTGSWCFSQTLPGKVFDAKGESGIAWVKVVNVRTDKFTYTDHVGAFEIFAESGDTVIFSLKNFRSKTVVLPATSQDPWVVYLEFDAIELPEVYVMEKNMNTSIKLHGINEVDPDYIPIGPGHVGMGATEDYRPGVAMAGPISFFSKSEKNKRQYQESEELRTAQLDYLEVVRSDSMRNELRTLFSLTREKYDSLLILFNAANRHHQFRDIEKERVEKMLFYFMNDAVRE